MTRSSRVVPQRIQWVRLDLQWASPWKNRLEALLDKLSSAPQLLALHARLPEIE